MAYRDRGSVRSFLMHLLTHDVSPPSASRAATRSAGHHAHHFSLQRNLCRRRHSAMARAQTRKKGCSRNEKESKGYEAHSAPHDHDERCTHGVLLPMGAHKGLSWRKGAEEAVVKEGEVKLTCRSLVHHRHGASAYKQRAVRNAAVGREQG